MGPTASPQRTHVTPRVKVHRVSMWIYIYIYVCVCGAEGERVLMGAVEVCMWVREDNNTCVGVNNTVNVLCVRLNV